MRFGEGGVQMTRSARSNHAAKPLSLATLLDHEVSALDEVVADVRGGVRDAAHFDALEQRVTDIAMGLRAAFRTAGQGAGRSVPR